MAEEQLYGELAYVLGMEKEDMPEYIAKCINAGSGPDAKK